MKQERNKNGFFSKVQAYIKNTAWIQPLLIVIVIFVLLWLINPISKGVTNLWNKISTSNSMQTITYQEYVEKVEAAASSTEDEKFIIVFSQTNCDYCPKFYKSVAPYLKESDYKDGTCGFKIYCVDISTRSTKIKLDGTKYVQYKDRSLGICAGKSTKSNILAIDYLKQLDARIDQFASVVGSSELSADTSDDATYKYVSTPLIVWYENGLETRISNKFADSFEGKWESSGKKVQNSAFRSFITDFSGTDGASNYLWTESFDLSYNTERNLKNAI